MRPLKTILALIALAALAAAPAVAAVKLEDMTLGKAKAPVKVIEYASAACSHCAKFNNDVFPAFRKKYIDTGQVHYTLREFLAGNATIAAMGFMTARCAPKARYFDVLDSIFQSDLFRASTGDPKEILAQVARTHGISRKAFDKCLADEAMLEAITAKTEEAARDGVRGTPVFFVNGARLPNVEMTLADLDAAIAAAKIGKDPAAAIVEARSGAAR